MEFLELAKKRASVRSYQAKPVEEEKLNKILEAARVAPSAKNQQPWRLIVVRSAEGREKLSRAANTYGAPVAVIVCADHSKTWIRPFDGKSSADIDASIATDHMMLQAEELGLGSVWICYFKPDVLRAEFQIPANWEPVNILAIGYSAQAAADPERHATLRLPLQDIVQYT